MGSRRTTQYVLHPRFDPQTLTSRSQKGIWAGWKDAPLSELGQKQAHAVGASLSTTRLTHIYASPLQRAHSTGRAVHSAQPHAPPFSVNPKLREQYFGVAEGHRWVATIPQGRTPDELIHEGIYPVLSGRTAKFPGGESLEDLARRAEEAIEECVVRHLDEGKDIHVALASHGLCISELVPALLRLDPETRKDVSYAGLLNTAWHRATVERREDGSGLRVVVTLVNQAEHLQGLVNAEPVEEDTSSSEARAFFGGDASKLESAHPATNAEI
ncbi:hypothetical protein DXG03_002395 [Asterophora parasitica]|uniref:Phosphoglycerate mutase n=1 Tax=Asterophora parasitica TaxID=117018 RepID=A0A9P7GDI8_9AGAR|nr:hypothetical protein DXG03_002395 [Asterophora parasitica]